MNNLMVFRGRETIPHSEKELLRKYYKVSWQFSKVGFFYFKDPHTNETKCLRQDDPYFIQFRQLTYLRINDIQQLIQNNNDYANRLQKQENGLQRGDDRTICGFQRKSSTITITAGYSCHGTVVRTGQRRIKIS